MSLAASRSVNVPMASLTTAANLAVSMVGSAFGIFARLQVAHIYFLLFLFGHIYLSTGCRLRPAALSSQPLIRRTHARPIITIHATTFRSVTSARFHHF